MLELLKRQITLITVSGIPVRVDNRWVLVLILMTGITAASIQSLNHHIPGSILLGLAATGLFFASIFLHEYAHAVVARREGLRVLEIVLHPFGGLARFEHPPETARTEFRVAVAGPAASFALAMLFAVFIVISSYIETDILTLVLFLLALTNFLIAVFNLLPGYPLDGGRVLRAYLWDQGKDLNEATVLTGRCGQVIAVGMIVLGLLLAVARGEYFASFWAVLVGFFLFDAATSIIQEVNSEENVKAETLMGLPATVPPDLTVQRFIDEILPMHRRSTFAVADSGRFLGMLVLDDLKAIASERWRTTLIRQTIRSRANEHFVHAENSIADARVLIERNGIGAVAVVADSGQLVGVIYAAMLRKRA
ncbi:MAG: site-2 protease family protein [bacterium]|nr:site-2 protease family protein [bacterium]